MNPAPFEAKIGDLEHGVRTISVRGELDLSTAPELEAPLEQALENDAGSVLIDLTQCEFIDSTGIALIVRAWQQREGADSFALCGIGDQVERVLDITGLESAIPTHGNREEAIAQLRD